MPNALLLLLLSLIVAARPEAARAGAPPAPHFTDCAHAFAAFEAEVGMKELTSTLSEVEAHRAPSVKEIGRRPGAYGGERLVLERIDASWGSAHAEQGHDVQGDPRWFIQMFGPEAAARLGFEQLSPTRITMPNVEEFRGALRALDAELTRRGAEPVALSFYPTATVESARVGEYLDAFVKTQGIPLAPHGNHFVHDLSFHAPSIVFPRSLLEEGAAWQEYWAGFGDYLRAKARAVPADQELARAYSYFIKYFGVTQVDYATAMLTPSYVSYLKRELGAGPGLHEYVREPVQILLPYTGINQRPSSPFEYAKSLLEGLFGPNPYEPLVSSPRYGGLTSALRAQLRETQRQFLLYSMPYRSARFPNFRPLESALQSPAESHAWLERMCQEIQGRRRVIRDAMLSLPAVPARAPARAEP